MAKKKNLKTVLTFVQDETGSMGGMEKETCSAFNEYFKTLKNEKDIGDIEAVVWQFSETPTEDRVRQLFRGALSKVPKLGEKNYKPRGVTPLLDAVGTAIRQAEAIEADRYLFIVQTDGLENASKDFTREQVAKLVKKKEKAKNWTLVFLGVGIEGWLGHARTYGVTGQSVVTADAGDIKLAYASAGVASGAFLRTNSVRGQVATDTSALMDDKTNKKSKTPSP